MDMAIQHIKNGFTKNKEKLLNKKMDWEEEERVRDKEIKNIERKLKQLKLILIDEGCLVFSSTM